MKHRPALPDDSVNVGHTHPLREAAWMTAAVIVILAATFWISGLLVDVVATRLPENTGIGLRPQIVAALQAEFGPPVEGPRARRVRRLLDELLQITGRTPDDVELLVLDNEQVNALAAPGGVIVVFTGLLDTVGSENELAMVLGHELGHLANRDHLRLLGRGLILSGISALVFGRTGGLDGQLLAMPTQLLQYRHSRTRERAADRTGVDTLCAFYGHGGGAEDFFARHDGDGLPPAFLASHPSPPDRVAQIVAYRDQIGCRLGEQRLLLNDK